MNTYLGKAMVKVRVVLAKYQPKNARFLIILDNTCILCINTTYGSKVNTYSSYTAIASFSGLVHNT